MSARDTICALASGAPPAAICVIRISGPKTRHIGESLLAGGLPPERRVVLARLHDLSGELIDEGLAVFFAGLASYTGEDTLELNLHGGPAVLEHTLRTLCEIESVRLAEPGEFTRRAFENGKLDLAEAEGVADIIEAETAAQKAQALRQISGGLSAVYDDWRKQLTGLLALIEVVIDFPDEGDAPEETTRPVIAKLDELISEISQALGDNGVGERIRDGFRLAIIGAPNAGKSTLLNRLAGREAAIVTDIPGTTRDVIEIRRVMGGHVVWIADTAGLRETEDRIEAEGVRRAEQAAKDADLRIFLFDTNRLPDLAELPGYRVATDIIVVNKIDARQVDLPPAAIGISAKTGEGVAHLEGLISAFIGNRVGEVEAPSITRARHREKLARGLDRLTSARAVLADGVGPELAGEDVRAALRALGSVVGAVDVEDVLGEVFSQFCIGK